MYKHIFVTMGILHTPYMVIMSMVSMVIMRLMYEVDEAKVSSVSERIGVGFCRCAFTQHLQSKEMFLCRCAIVHLNST